MADPTTVYYQKSTTVRFILGSFRLVFRLLGAVSPAAAAAFGVRVFTTIRRHRVPAREARWLASARRFELPGPNGPTPAWSWGAGRTVLLVHGWEGRAGQMGALGEAIAATGLRAVAIDLPGHGHAPGRRTNLVEMATAIEMAAAALGPLAAVVAHSAGAVSTTWALGRGVDAERAAFVAPGTGLAGYISGFARIVGLSPRLADRMRRHLEAKVGVPMDELEPSSVAPRLETPLRVVSDLLDDEAPIAGVRALVAAWPDAVLDVTSGLGHRRILRDEAVVAGVVEWAAGHDRDQRAVSDVA